MTATRASKAAGTWRKLLCAPNGELTADGRLVLADLAKFCRFQDGPTRHADAAVDVPATMEAIGMQKVYLRVCTLLAIDELAALRIGMQPLPTEEEFT